MRIRALVPAVLLVLSAAIPPAHAATKWSLIISDDFNGTQIDHDIWAVYGHTPPIPPKCWDPADVIVGGGQADLIVKKISGCDGFSAGGMCVCPLSTQVYGKYEVRIKLEPGPTKFNALLWGAGQWPPEVDFAEVPATGDGQARQMFTQTLHYGSANNQLHTSTDADLTTWHTVGVEWSPGLIAYTLDGEVTNSITSHVPTTAMYLAVQTSDQSSPPSTIDSWVDWVHVYEYTG